MAIIEVAGHGFGVLARRLIEAHKEQDLPNVGGFFLLLNALVHSKKVFSTHCCHLAE